MLQKNNKVNTVLRLLYGITVMMLLSYSPRAISQEETRADIPLRLYRCSLSSSGSTIEKEQAIDVYFIVENYRKQQSPEVEFSIVVPPFVSILYGEGKHTIDAMPYRNTQSVFYKLIISHKYAEDSIPIDIWMSNDDGILSLCYRATIRVGQTESFATIRSHRGSSLPKGGDVLVKEESAQSHVTQRYQVTSTSKLNVRQRPSTLSKKIGTLSKGDYVNVYGIENNWAEIDYKQQRAYVSAKYIETAKESDVDTIRDAFAEDVRQSDIHPESIVENKPINEQKPMQQNLCFVAALASGYSNLTSPDANSYGSIGLIAEIGARYHWGFLPENMFMDATLGFALLGNSHYSFPYFSLNLYPIEIQHKLFNHSFFAQMGFSLMLGGNDMHINRGSFYRTYHSTPNVVLMLKESIEISSHWNVGLQYIRGLNNVCENLPIGLYHESIQVFATYKFSIK